MSSHVDFKRSNTERLSSRLHDYWAGRTLSDIPSTAEEHGSHTADYWDGDQAGKNAKVFLAADYTGAGESSYSPGSNVHSYWNGLSTDKDLTDVYLKKRRNTTAFLQGLATGCNGPSALVLGELASTICWQLKAGEGDPTATLVWLGSQILSQIAVKLSIKSKDAIQKAFATTYRCLLARVPGTGAHVHTEPLCWVPTVYAQCTEDLAGRANALSLSLVEAATVWASATMGTVTKETVANAISRIVLELPNFLSGLVGGDCSGGKGLGASSASGSFIMFIRTLDLQDSQRPDAYCAGLLVRPRVVQHVGSRSAPSSR
jgi:hypothetical protein